MVLAADALAYGHGAVLSHTLPDGTDKAVATFLLRYRTTPHSTTEVSSCSLFMKWELHTHLDLLSPSVGERVQDKQQKQRESRNRHAVPPRI